MGKYQQRGEETIMITDIEAIKTLSKTRNVSEMSRASGVTYAQLSKWESEAKQGTLTEAEYYGAILLEYLRRRNRRQIIKMAAKYDLGEKMKDEEGSLFFPIEVHLAYRESAIGWKKDILSEFIHMGRHLYEAQIRILQVIIFAEYGIPVPTAKVTEKMEEAVSHL